MTERLLFPADYQALYRFRTGNPELETGVPARPGLAPVGLSPCRRLVLRDIGAESIGVRPRNMNRFRVVSDLVCPWCYIGKRRLEAALHELPPGTDAAVSWHPFQLNPGMPPEGMDRNEYRLRKFGDAERCRAMDAQLTEVGKSVGIDFRFDLQSTIPNTFDSHRVIWLAGRLGVQDSVMEALFRAYFREGANFSERAQLVKVAVAAGLEAARVERLLGSEEGAAQVHAEEREVKAFGVSAVPLFIIQDRIAVSGAQPPEVLLQALAQAQELPRKQRRPAKERAKPGCDPAGCKA
jgi:predicted DsbA family dithiol-disulfide isomerase